MTDKHALPALVMKRAEIAALIVDARAVLRGLIIDLDNIDAAIRIFNPDYDVEGIKPKKTPPVGHITYRGALVRVILTLLREAPGPLTTKEVGLHMMRERGLNTADPELVVVFNRRARALLHHYKRRGIVRAVRGNEEGRRRFNWWELAV